MCNRDWAKFAKKGKFYLTEQFGILLRNLSDFPRHFQRKKIYTANYITKLQKCQKCEFGTKIQISFSIFCLAYFLFNVNKCPKNDRLNYPSKSCMSEGKDLLPYQIM